MVSQSVSLEELKNTCGVPEAELKEFLACRETAGEGPPRFSEADMKEFSEFLTLRSIGFSPNQRKDYLKLSAKSSGAAEKIRMLGTQRRKLLDRVHELEQKISRIDYMKHELGSGQPEGRGLKPGAKSRSAEQTKRTKRGPHIGGAISTEPEAKS